MFYVRRRRLFIVGGRIDPGSWKLRGEHSPSNLVTLCRICHEKVHAKTLRLMGNAEYGLGSVEGSVDVLDGLEEILERAARWSFRSSGA